MSLLYVDQLPEEKLNLPYYDKHIPELLKYYNEGYKFIGADMGSSNLIVIHEAVGNKRLRYSRVQYLTESFLHKNRDKINILEAKKSHGELTQAEYNQWKKIKKTAEIFGMKSFVRFSKQVEEKFGKKIILCIGDSGCNHINIQLVKFLSDRFKCFLVDEYLTSQLCCVCGSRVKKLNKISRALARCTNNKCHITFYKDSNACDNIMLKVLKGLGVLESEEPKTNYHDSSNLTDSSQSISLQQDIVDSSLEIVSLDKNNE